jgi:tellurite resistance protein
VPPLPLADESLLEKVASRLGQTPAYADAAEQGSIWRETASSYGFFPSQDRTMDFDPGAAALFEAIVESAYLVANADGDFDETERAAFKHVVVSACVGRVGERQVDALLADLSQQLSEDGMDKRIQMVSRVVRVPEHACEVLRIAALLAHVSGGVSDVEREVLEKLTEAFQLLPDALDSALGEAERVLAG